MVAGDIRIRLAFTVGLKERMPKRSASSIRYGISVGIVAVERQLVAHGQRERRGNGRQEPVLDAERRVAPDLPDLGGCHRPAGTVGQQVLDGRPSRSEMVRVGATGSGETPAAIATRV